MYDRRDPRSTFALLACAAVAATLFTACQRPTSFQGEARFPGGPRGCWDRCVADSLEMASYVYVGEYSTACACRPRATAPAPGARLDTEDEAFIASVAGVELQRRRIEEEQYYQQQQQQQRLGLP